ncbi:MAG TPA: hydrogenase formation protein HypD [Candidatus Moranbacteria bacterium]|nr:hydrogenase formation protein HypD [Candidatus Moranbacteria bacterium]HAT74625.1 hydrogenase formation protein HypD [Candidatus Moranbacteria bacterium]
MNPEKIIKNINKISKKIGREVRLMELCGTHSQTVARYGIKNILPKNIKLVSGPGCPVCVTDQSDIDIIVGLANAGISIAAYGDVLDVPGNIMSLSQARQRGARVFAVYNVAEVLKLKEKYSDIVFFGLGFETTAPATAWAIKKGIIAYSLHKLFPPAMAALLKSAKTKSTSPQPSPYKGEGDRIDGFINPGHVSAIIGTEVYKKFKAPQVVAGFEAQDVLRAIEMLLAQIVRKEKKVENEYCRVVKKEGNKKALDLINEVFEVGDAKWRGLGEIKNSGLKIRKKYQNQNAEFIYCDLIEKLRSKIIEKPSACKCGLVLQGLIEPKDCLLFKEICTPENPQGACMVSVEGACNVEYRYNNAKCKS